MLDSVPDWDYNLKGIAMKLDKVSAGNYTFPHHRIPGELHYVVKRGAYWRVENAFGAKVQDKFKNLKEVERFGDWLHNVLAKSLCRR